MLSLTKYMRIPSIQNSFLVASVDQLEKKFSGREVSIFETNIHSSVANLSPFY